VSSSFPSKATVERLRGQYPAGTRVELISMDDPSSSLKPGDRGTVAFVDDIGTVAVTWDNGSHLGLAYGADQFKTVTEGPHYETGADFWRDTAVCHGKEEAIVICRRYLDAQIRTGSREENQFCQELFTAMYEATAGKTDPAHLVYPYNFMRADERLESSFYHGSRKRNDECAKAIDDVIHKSCYEPNYYNLRGAARAVVAEYGFERVKLVLAHQIQHSDWDGRYSRANKEWAKGLDIPVKPFERAILNAHPVLIEDFTNYTRKLYGELGAERFALPGRAESGQRVAGYEIARMITFNDQRGFAIGHNPDAVNPYATWQFSIEAGVIDFYWGAYSNSEKDAADNYTARTMVHMSGGDVREVDPPARKQSVRAQLEEARKAPAQPHKAVTKERKADLEL